MFTIVFVWFVASIIVGLAASKRADRWGFAWFVLALLISPILAVLALIAVGKKKPVMRVITADNKSIDYYKRNPTAEVVAICLGIGCGVMLLVLGMMGS